MSSLFYIYPSALDGGKLLGQHIMHVQFAVTQALTAHCFFHRAECTHSIRSLQPGDQHCGGWNRTHIIPGYSCVLVRLHCILLRMH